MGKRPSHLLFVAPLHALQIIFNEFISQTKSTESDKTNIFSKLPIENYSKLFLSNFDEICNIKYM